MAKKEKGPIDIMTPVEEPVTVETTEKNKEEIDNIVNVDIIEEERTVSADEYDDLYNKYLMSLADFENYKKRTNNIISNLQVTGGKKVFEALIPALNTIYASIKNSNEDGPNLIFKAITDALKTVNANIIEPKIGDVFNSDTMNAIATAAAPDVSADNTIVDVMSPGYSMGQNIIEYPKVVVYKA